MTAVFILEEESGKEVSFQRSVQGASSEYRINGSVSSFSFGWNCASQNSVAGGFVMLFKQALR